MDISHDYGIELNFDYDGDKGEESCEMAEKQIDKINKGLEE